MWSRRSMMRTRSLRWLAIRSAMTLPAKPAPTINQSNTGNTFLGGGGNRLQEDAARQNLLMHRFPGLIPGARCELAVDSGEPRRLALRHELLGAAHELFRRTCDLDEAGRAIGPNHVANWRRDHR